MQPSKADAQGGFQEYQRTALFNVEFKGGNRDACLSGLATWTACLNSPLEVERELETPSNPIGHARFEVALSVGRQREEKWR